MDKYEYKIKADEIKELIAEGDFIQAADIADGIDWRRVKSVMMLCTISDLYKINRRYEDAKNMLLLAYERRPGGRAICYSLCEICIKTEDYVEALNYYKEFTQVAPKDSSRYILQYKLYEAQEVGLEERINVLEELKKRDYREKWAYELAYLYHRAGLATRCVEECDELILWFGEGKYVIKAMELKMLHQPLTPTQQQMYEHRFHRRRPKAGQAEGYGEEGSYGQPEDYGEEGSYGQPEGYGEEGSYNQPEGYGEEGSYNQPEGYGEEGSYGQPEGYGEEGSYGQPEGYGEEVPYGQPEGYGEEVPYDQSEGYGENAPYEQAGMEGDESAENAAMTEPELDIQVKPVDVGEYNTINLQAELAAGLQEVLGAENVGFAADSTQESGAEAPLQDPEEDAEGTEVFFGETGELDGKEADGKAVEPEASAALPGVLNGEEAMASETEAVSAEEPVQKEVLAADNAAEAEQKPEGASDVRKELLLSVQPPKELADLLRQETDGQIQIVLPENIDVEKQITGQMKIEDVLAEWERTKRENEEKYKEEMRRNVLRDTGNMFNEFETAVREGLLEQLENGTAEEGAIEEQQAQASSEDIEDFSEEEIWEIAAEETEESETADGAEYIEDPDDMEALDSIEPVDDTEILNDIEVLDDAEEAETLEEAEAAAEEEAEQEEQAQASQKGQRPPIERDKEKIRGLTREEKELYAPFIQSRHSREQLVKAIDSISMAAYTGNVVITGDEGMDTMTLAKNMIREVKMTDSNFSGKVAKITGQGLNQRNVREILEQLKNGALIIQDAAGMEARTAAMLYKSLQQERVGVIVVMEDTKKAIQKLFLGTPELFGCFNARVDLEAFSNETLVSFGRRYAQEMEYAIDDLGVLALHTRIEELQTIDHVVTVIEVKKIVDQAIQHARRRTLGHFLDVLLARRYDDEDMIILTEKDFAA